MFERVVTYPWAAEGAGGEAGRGSTNRPRPVAQTRKKKHRGRGNLSDQRVYLLHVSVNTGGGESLEVTCCTQLESTTAYVSIIPSTVVANQALCKHNTYSHKEGLSRTTQ